MGKETNMSKYRIKKNLFNEITHQKDLILWLQKTIDCNDLPDKEKDQAKSLHYKIVKGGYSWKVKQFANALIRKYKRVSTPSRIVKSQFLYAISDGTNIKLGFTGNLKGRLNNLQSANSNNLTLLWKMYIGKCPVKAKDAERKLHKTCKEFKLKGEWYTKFCLRLVQTFSYRG